MIIQKRMLIAFIFITSVTFSQQNKLNKMELKFNMFKFPDSEYIVDFNSMTFSLKEIYRYDMHDEIIYNKTYQFSQKVAKIFLGEMIKAMPDSLTTKFAPARDGGGFTIKYTKDDTIISELSCTNIYPPEKFPKEYELIEKFFEFAYNIVGNDEKGIKVLDHSYRPYFTGLPIRKVNDNPLEYKIWGTMHGDCSDNDGITDFLNSLPLNKCIIIDCDNQLSYALQQCILLNYMIKGSNIKFANNNYFKYLRENLMEISNAVKSAKRNNKEFVINNLDDSQQLYFSNPALIEKWLDSPESNMETSIEKLRKECLLEK